MLCQEWMGKCHRHYYLLKCIFTKVLSLTFKLASLLAFSTLVNLCSLAPLCWTFNSNSDLISTPEQLGLQDLCNWNFNLLMVYFFTLLITQPPTVLWQGVESFSVTPLHRKRKRHILCFHLHTSQKCSKLQSHACVNAGTRDFTVYSFFPLNLTDWSLAWGFYSQSSPKPDQISKQYLNI